MTNTDLLEEAKAAERRARQGGHLETARMLAGITLMMEALVAQEHSHPAMSLAPPEVPADMEQGSKSAPA